jgi:hypothetical protein
MSGSVFDVRSSVCGCERQEVTQLLLMLTSCTVCCRFDEECRGQVAENLAKRGVVCHAGHLPTK